MICIFKEKSKIVHSYHGIGTVQSIETRELLGDRATLVVCTFSQGDHEEMTMLINLDRDHRLIRPLVRAEEVPEVLSHLERYVPETLPKYTQRIRFFTEKLKSSDIRGRCELIRDLRNLAARKALTDKERDFHDTALKLLITELAYVTGKPRSDIEERVEQACGPLPQAPVRKR